MMPWLIDLTARNVIIVGGGQVATCKVKQFLNEGANIKIIALNVADEIKRLDVDYYEKAYHSKYLTDAFLVYAATNNSDLNRQIVADANKKGILSASATKSASSLRSMKKVKTENMILGVSTGYPAFSKKIEEELIIYDDYLMWLRKIRNIVLKNNLVDYIERKSFFNNMLLFNKSELELIYNFLITRKGKLLIFSVHLDSLTNNFTRLLNALAISYYDQNYSDKLAALTSLMIDWKIQPMVISYGKIYDKLKSSTEYYLVEKPLFINNEILDKLYASNKKRLFLIHPRSNTNLQLLLKNYGYVHEFDQPLSTEINFDQVIPFVLTKGYHYKKHIMEIIKEDLNINLNCVLLEDKTVVNNLVELIKLRFNNK